MNVSSTTALMLLRIGLVFAFLYPALSAFANPSLWIGYVPTWVETFIPREIFLLIFSSIEIVVALGILFWDSIIPPLIAGAVLLGIVIANYNEFSVVFRDLSIACMAFALAFLVRTSREK